MLLTKVLLQHAVKVKGSGLHPDGCFRLKMFEQSESCVGAAGLPVRPVIMHVYLIDRLRNHRNKQVMDIHYSCKEQGMLEDVMYTGCRCVLELWRLSLASLQEGVTSLHHVTLLMHLRSCKNAVLNAEDR